MMKKYLIGLILSGLVMGSVGQANAAQATSSFTPKQKKEIGEVVKQYLLENPSVLVDVSQKLRAQQMEEAQKQALKVIGENVNELVSAASPMLGNQQGSIVLVQFIDYQCGHCKQMQAIIDKLITENQQLKVVSKNLGILGANSDYAAKASLAANMQGKFSLFHGLLEQAVEPLNQERILSLAKEAGLDVPKLEQDLKSDIVSKEMANTLQLAQKIGLSGTPAFIILANIGEKKTKVFFASGAVAQTTLQDFIDQVKS